MKITLKRDKTLETHTLCITFHDMNHDSLHNIKRILSCYLQRVKVYSQEHDQIFIYTYDIYYAEVIDNKVFLYTKDNCYRSYHSFSFIRKDIATYGLKQINKNTLINPQHVVKIHIDKDCKRILTLDNNEQLVISRRFRTVL